MFGGKIHFTLRIGVFTFYKTTSPQELFPSDYITLYTIYCLHRTCMLQINMACFFLVHTLDKMTPPVYSSVHWTLYARYLKITDMFNWSPCSRPPGLFMLGLKMPKSTIILHYESRKNANANAPPPSRAYWQSQLRCLDILFFLFPFSLSAWPLPKPPLMALPYIFIFYLFFILRLLYTMHFYFNVFFL